MVEEMCCDDDVFFMGEEVVEYQGVYKILQGFLDEFGVCCVIDILIIEYGFVGIVIGVVFVGLKLIVEFMIFNFVMQVIDYLINLVVKMFYMLGGQMGVLMVFCGLNGVVVCVGVQYSQDYVVWYL